MKLFKNPFLQTVIALFIGYVFYALSLKDVQPLYSILKAEVLVEVTDMTPQLKLLWKGKNIKSVYKTDVIIFNNGKNYIDSKNISKTDRVRIELNKKSKLLSYNILKTSRDDLNFTLKKVEDNDNIKIVIRIKGDEAYEYKDGLIVSLLFSGSPVDNNIKVAGRIKGSSNKVFTPISSAYLTEKKTDLYSFAILAFIFLSSSLFFTFSFIKKIINSGFKSILSYSLVLYIPLMLVCYAFASLSTYFIFNKYSYLLSWYI